MKEIEIEGKTVTMAVEKGLAEIGLRRDQVEVEVLVEASPGFLGLGAKMARVRITEKIWGDAAPDAPSRPPSAEGRPPRTAEGRLTSRPPRSSEGRPARPTESRPARPTESRPPRSSEGRPPRSGDHPPVVPEGRGQEPDSRRGPSRPPRHGSDERRPSPRTYSGPSSRPGPSSSRAPYQRPEKAQPPADTGKACSEAKALLLELFGMMHLEVKDIVTDWDAAQLRVHAEVDTPDGTLLIGKDGRTLESLQFLSTLMLSRRMKTPVAVQVETQGYWKQKEESIMIQVHQAIEEVQRTGRPVRLTPMEASLRRLVHRSLAESPEVETVSEGEGVWRKIVLRPKKK